MSEMIISEHEAGHGSYTSYVIGFIASIVLTIAAYLLVSHHALTGLGLVTALLGLGVVQLFVQLVFFLHLGRESKPRWNITALIFMLIVVLIVVGGSLWIMTNLNYHHQSSQQVNQYLSGQDGL